MALATQFWQLDNLVGSGFKKKKSIKAAVWQSVLSDFLIFQQAVVELYHFNSSVLSFPKISPFFKWLPFFCSVLAPAPRLTYLQRKHHRIMLSGWVIPVMKVALFLGNGSKNICMVNLYAKMSRRKGWGKPLPLPSPSLSALLTESILSSPASSQAVPGPPSLRLGIESYARRLLSSLPSITITKARISANCWASAMGPTFD